MAVLVASMESLFTPLMSGERFRYAYNNVATHSHHHVVAVRCLSLFRGVFASRFAVLAIVLLLADAGEVLQFSNMFVVCAVLFWLVGYRRFCAMFLWSANFDSSREPNSGG